MTREVVLVASGDLRETANRLGWPAQAELERNVARAPVDELREHSGEDDHALRGWTERFSFVAVVRLAGDSHKGPRPYNLFLSGFLLSKRSARQGKTKADGENGFVHCVSPL